MFPDNPLDPPDQTDPRVLHPPGTYELVPINQFYVGTVSLMMPPKSQEQDEELVASIQVDGVIEAINATPCRPNREGIVRHRLDNGRHRLAAARIVGIDALWTKWNDPAWSHDELIRKMLAVESTGRVWTRELRHEFIVKLNEEEHRTARQIVALTGWSLGSVGRALRLGELDAPGKPGEHPEVGSERYLELVRQATDPDVSEDERHWARGDGAAAIKSERDERQRGNWLDDRNARTADFRKYAADVGLEDPRELVPFWRTSIAWPRADRVRGASWSDHARFNQREGRKELLRAAMAKDAPAPADEIHRCISEACSLVVDAFNIAWEENRDDLLPDDHAARRMRYGIDLVQGMLGRLQAYLDGGREGYWDYDEEHPHPADIYEHELGPGIPATEKWKELDSYDEYGIRHPRRRP